MILFLNTLSLQNIKSIFFLAVYELPECQKAQCMLIRGKTLILLSTSEWTKYAIFMVVQTRCIYCYNSVVDVIGHATALQIEFCSTRRSSMAEEITFKRQPTIVTLLNGHVSLQVQVDQEPQHKTRSTESNRRESGKEP